MVAQPRPVESEGVTRRFPLPGWQPINTDTGWTLTNCEPYAGHRSPMFRYDPETGEVRLRGLLKVITTVPPSLTMPEYLKVPSKEVFPSGTDSSSVQQFIRLNVNETGTITWDAGSTALAVNNYLTLGGVVWYTDAAS